MFLVLIFGFFVVAKIHVYKFRHYSVNIEPVTKVLATILLILALVGYYFLFSEGTGSKPTQTVEQSATTEIY